MNGYDVIALFAALAFFGWLGWLGTRHLEIGPSETFICHGNWESQHLYQGEPPCPQCEADRKSEGEE